MLAHRPFAVVVSAVALMFSSCSGDDDSTTTETTASTTPMAADSTQPSPENTPATPVSTPVTTQAPPPTIPAPVPEEGSARDVISQRDDLSNIDAAVDAWLIDSPGREGVLRNARGLTLFIPNNDGFTEDALAIALDDFDAFTIFLSEHLKVGAVRSDQLGDGVSTAMGVTYPVGDGTVGDSTMVEIDIEATNGVIHIIDRPLTPIVPG